MSEKFKNIPKIRFEGKDSKNPLAFKYYDADRVIMGKTMREHGSLGENIKKAFQRLVSVLSLAVNLQKIRGFTILIQKRLWATSTERRHQYLSALWIKQLVSHWTLKFAVMVNIPTELQTQCFSTPMYVQM